MTAFVQTPSLPKRCQVVILGEKYAEKLRNPLQTLQIETLLLPDNPFLDSRLSGHADLSVLHAGGEELLLAPYLKGSAFAARLHKAGAALLFPDVSQGAVYPADAQFNVCIVGENILYNKRTVPSSVVESLTSEDRKPVNCRQGYARCAVCVVDEHALITADRGIAAAAETAGLDVLLISPGFIRLDGFPYGFLGGAAFKLSENVMAFTGRLDAHPDQRRILDYLEQRGIQPLYLTEEDVFDIGCAIPILEGATSK